MLFFVIEGYEVIRTKLAIISKCVQVMCFSDLIRSQLWC